MTVHVKLRPLDASLDSEKQRLRPAEITETNLRLFKTPWLYMVAGLVAFVIVLISLDDSKCPHRRNANYTSNKITPNDSLTYIGQYMNHSSLSGKTDPSSLKEELYRMVCYYVIPSNNSRVRNLPPEAVDPYFCSHIIIGFSNIENGTIQPQTGDYTDIYKKIINFKKVNPSLKVLLSVEDISSNGGFSKMVASAKDRTNFIVDTIRFLKKFSFDGVDLDWEFPSWPNADLTQVKNYSLLISELRQYVDKEAKGLLLSAAVAAPDLIIQQSYEVDELAKYLDFVNIMCYDYHLFTPYLPLTGPNAPLYSSAQEQGYSKTLNTDWSAMQWVQLGMPREKINIGIPTYGHSFRLINEDNNGWNAPARNNGDTGIGGFITYPNACSFLSNTSTTHIFDDSYDVPYAFNGKEWISFENKISVSLKASYIKNHKFGGAMIYSLNSDDFYGECGDRKFALTREIDDILTPS